MVFLTMLRLYLLALILDIRNKGSYYAGISKRTLVERRLSSMIGPGALGQPRATIAIYSFFTYLVYT